MLSVIAELHFEGVRVVSVADGLDSEDEEATLGIQIRGIFNELQLQDLRKKRSAARSAKRSGASPWARGRLATAPCPWARIRMDKKGRPRPDGYRMEIEPREAGVVLRVFTAYADGLSVSRIVRTLNEEGVPGRFRSAKGWSPATVSRMLDNEKYVGRWTWNQDGDAPRPQDWQEAQVPEAEVRVDHP
jgi:DNA invertase Pin-like site-specific DNA recombinase